MVKKKVQSKRVKLSRKYSIQKKVKEHNRKAKRAAKKNPQRRRKPKDPGIPNSWPFKEELLNEIERHKQELLEEKQREKEARQAEKRKQKEEEQRRRMEEEQQQQKQEEEEDDDEDEDEDMQEEAEEDDES